MDINRPPLVSVIIPTYKRSEKLSRAIKSVINQTYANVEVLVVSDNEPNDEFTAEAQRIVESFNDNRVLLVLQKHHKNGAAARNAGIRSAKGEFIAFLDDDDFWDKEKLEIQVPVLLSLDESWGGVSCLNKIFQNGKLSHLQQGYKSGYIFKKILQRRLEVSTDTILLRKKCLIETGMFNENLLRNQEVQMLAFFTQKYKLHLIEKYRCNVDIDDILNRPSPEKYKKVKIEFLKAVEPVMRTLSPYMRMGIKLSNKFELGGLCILTGEYLKGLFYCSSILISPSACISAYTRVHRRKLGRRIPKEFQETNLQYFIEKNNL